MDYATRLVNAEREQIGEDFRERGVVGVWLLTSGRHWVSRAIFHSRRTVSRSATHRQILLGGPNPITATGEFDCHWGT